VQALPKFEFFEPHSIDEATALLAGFGAQGMIIGGGTDLVPSMRQGLFEPKYVMSLQNIGALAEVRWDDAAGLEIGALTTLRSLEQNADIARRLPIIAAAAHAVASPQLRQMATVGGNLCLDTRCHVYNQSDTWRSCNDPCLKMGGVYCTIVPRAKKCFAVFSADLAPALVALDAQVTLISARGSRTISLKDFYTGNGAKPNGKEPDEVLTKVVVPARMAGYRATYLKFRLRESIDFPVAGVALSVRLEGERAICRDPRLVITGVATAPLMVKGIDELLDGVPLTASAIENAAALAKKTAIPVANAAGAHGHRKQMIYELTRMAFEKLMG
jgi:4-hydroxybenzoyl-CoA reductase subunit beta